MEKENKPIYRFTINREESGKLSVIKEKIPYYYEVLLGNKVIYRYRDLNSHTLRDVKPEKMDALSGNVLYSFDQDMKKALKNIQKRITSDVTMLERELTVKRSMQEALQNLIKDYPK